MYAPHFDLNGRPFGAGIAQDDARFVDDLQQASALPAGVALSSPDAAMVLLGPPGVGKTTLAANTLRTSSADMRSAVAWLGTPPATGHELLELLLAEFGFQPYLQSRAERLQTWRQFLTELGATATRVFIALERAHDVDPGILLALDSLTAADPNGCPGANLILMGTEELAVRIDEPLLTSLRQRVRLIRRLRPLDPQAVEGYLRHALALAGGTLERVFAPDGVTALSDYSGGIPRMLNHLADSALSLAALREQARVDAALVSVVATELYGLAPAYPGSAAEPAASGLGKRADVPNRSADRYAAAPADHDDHGDDIPVLTESVDADSERALSDDEDQLEPVDPAATLTLLGDADLEGLSAEIAAELLAAEKPVDGDPIAADDGETRAGDGTANNDRRKTRAFG